MGALLFLRVSVQLRSNSRFVKSALASWKQLEAAKRKADRDPYRDGEDQAVEQISVEVAGRRPKQWAVAGMEEERMWAKVTRERMLKVWPPSLRVHDDAKNRDSMRFFGRLPASFGACATVSAFWWVAQANTCGCSDGDGRRRIHREYSCVMRAKRNDSCRSRLRRAVR